MFQSEKSIVFLEARSRRWPESVPCERENYVYRSSTGESYTPTSLASAIIGSMKGKPMVLCYFIRMSEFVQTEP